MTLVPKRCQEEKERSYLCWSSGRVSVKFTELKSISDHQLEPSQDSLTNFIVVSYSWHFEPFEICPASLSIVLLALQADNFFN